MGTFLGVACGEETWLGAESETGGVAFVLVPLAHRTTSLQAGKGAFVLRA